MMKQRSRTIALFAALFCVLALFVLPMSAFAAEQTDFVPVLRFVASSDTHVTREGDVRTQRIEKMLAQAYETARCDANYNALDAVLVAGDLTDDGTPEQFEAFERTFESCLNEETALLAVVAKNHDGYQLSRDEVREICSRLTGNGADFDAVLNGYHFIGLSASANKVVHYDAGQLRWLNSRIRAAVREDPNKPVFVIRHEPTVETTYGSRVFDGWGVPYFGALLRQYPQVVEICGHSHYPLNDPRSVWQGAYTAINTGAIKNAEFTVEELRSYHPADYNEIASYWIIEVNAQNDLHLCGMDANAGEVLCDYILKNPADRANRDFTPAKQKAASRAPVFAEDAALRVALQEGGCKVTAPAAQSADGMPIVLYHIEAKDACGLSAAKSWTLPQYYRADGADEIELELKNLAEGTYTVYVTAENAYGMRSSCLQTTVTVQGENGFLNLFTRLKQLMQDIKEFFVHLFW